MRLVHIYNEVNEKKKNISNVKSIKIAEHRKCSCMWRRYEWKNKNKNKESKHIIFIVNEDIQIIFQSKIAIYIFSKYILFKKENKLKFAYVFWLSLMKLQNAINCNIEFKKTRKKKIEQTLNEILYQQAKVMISLISHLRAVQLSSIQTFK